MDKITGIFTQLTMNHCMKMKKLQHTKTKINFPDIIWAKEAKHKRKSHIHIYICIYMHLRISSLKRDSTNQHFRNQDSGYRHGDSYQKRVTKGSFWGAGNILIFDLALVTWFCSMCYNFKFVWDTHKLKASICIALLIQKKVKEI